MMIFTETGYEAPEAGDSERKRCPDRQEAEDNPVFRDMAKFLKTFRQQHASRI